MSDENDEIEEIGTSKEIPEKLVEALPSLKRVADALNCPICYSFFKTPLVTKCGHTFCSLCIRQHHSYKQNCPICFKPMSESELLPAKIMSDIMGPFATLLDNLKLLADSPNPDCQREFKAMADKNNEEKKEI